MANQNTLDIGISEFTSPATLKAAFTEFLATTLFIFIGVGSVAAFVAASSQDSALVDGLPVIALGFGLAIAVLAAGVGPISGGHINPAVTFAMTITGNISVVRGLMYIVAQLIGAVIGMLLLKAFVTADAFGMIPAIGGNGLSDAVPSNLAGGGWKRWVPSSWPGRSSRLPSHLAVPATWRRCLSALRC